MTPKTRFNTAYFFIAALGIIFIHDAMMRRLQVPEIPYSQFQTLLAEKKVKEVVISQNHLRGTLKTPGPDGKTRFITTRVAPDLAQTLEGAGITYRAVLESNALRQLLAWTVPTLIFFGVWWLLAKKAAAQMGGGFMALGKSKAKVYVETDTKVTFADVAGVEEAKEELVEIVDFLKDPQSHGRLGGRMPKGVLLVGPPGTGKTLLAKAVAGEARVPFFSISGSEFVEMFVGVGAARVRDLFEQARSKAPAIIFIDELDALGRARTPGMVGGHDEKEQTLNQLLVELDGFDSGAGLVLLAATNRPEVLDPALLRAGRFDRQVLVDRPDKAGRAAILSVHLKKITLDPGVAILDIAGLTPGFTGADLANLVNEAALIATRRKAAAVTQQDFTAAIERLVAGLEKKNRLLSPRDREIVAHHEMGHALVAAALPGQDPVHKISIIPRGIGALGYTLQRPTEDRYLMTREELENRMTVLLGGRAAEWLFFEHLSTGAADDLAKATDIARGMATRYGMSEDLGHAVYDTEPRGFLGIGAPPKSHSEASARAIDEAVRARVNRAFDRALSILAAHRAIAAEGAQRLLAKETLDETDLKDLFKSMFGVPS